MNSVTIKKHQKEIHIILLWSEALRIHDLQFFRKDIRSKFRILEIYKIKWDKSIFVQNISRLYGVKLDDASGKMSHCGSSEFVMFTVLDDNPIYEFIETSRGTEYVNKNLFNVKTRYREYTNGGHKVHTTNNTKETNHDLSLLLGINYNDYMLSHQKNTFKDNKIINIERNLSGANGWKNLQEFFYIINACIDYVVLRNFDDLPEKHDNKINGDIDLLVDNFKETCLITNSRKVFKELHRVHCVTKINNEDVFFDFRYLGDKYYHYKWQKDILSHRVLNEKNIYTPSEEHHYYSFLYHVLLHKVVIHEKNNPNLINFYGKLFNTARQKMDLDLYYQKLIEFMNNNNYSFEKPIDISVHFDQRYIEDFIIPIKMELKKYFISNVEPYLVGKWKNGSGFIYFSGTDLNNNKLFIKYVYDHNIVIAEREFRSACILYNHNSKNFLKPYYYNNNFVAYLFLEDSTSLEKCDSLKLKNDRSNLIEQLFSILNSLHSNGLIHRDIKPSNFILYKERLILIDYQWILSKQSMKSFYKESSFIQNNQQFIQSLGEEFSAGKFYWDDAVSILKVINFIDVDFQSNDPELFSKINSKINFLTYRHNISIKHKLKSRVKNILKKFKVIRKIKNYLKGLQIKSI